MATHMVNVREDLLQRLITLSQETGKPMSDLIEEVLDWARQQSQLRQSRSSQLQNRKTG
jgi:predicted DNA-binding protein